MEVLLMNIIESLGKLTGTAGKVIVKATASTAGSFMKGFTNSFKTPEVITPDQTEQQPQTQPQPVQAELDFGPEFTSK